MNRLQKLFSEKENILNIYTTAGYPKLNDTVEVVTELAKSGADVIEIGMPFSDPLADGPTIQNSSEIAIQNGITLDIIFDQVAEIRKSTNIPVLLMGYYNQLLQYGVEHFLKRAQSVGVDGLIIPDLPIDIYRQEYKSMFVQYDINMSFLITPQTTNERIDLIAKESTAFLYVVSSFAITGGKSGIDERQLAYFNKIKNLNIKTPKLIGFGISDRQTFETACQYADGAIIGSAFIKALSNGKQQLSQTIHNFIKDIK